MKTLLSFILLVCVCVCFICFFFLILELLQHNTSMGPFQKLGRLYESCLRQSINSSYVKLKMQEIGTYMPMTVSGPATIGGLILKLSELGPTPLVSIYYDLSFGRRPQPMLIIDSSFESAPLLQNSIRWTAPKAAPFDIKYDIPPLLDNIIDVLLPASLDTDKREFERETIVNFIRQFTQLRRESLRKGFTDSHVLYNVSALSTIYPFVSGSIVYTISTNVSKELTCTLNTFFTALLGKFDYSVKLFGTNSNQKWQLLEKCRTIGETIYKSCS